jgi:hypothetical protein
MRLLRKFMTAFCVAIICVMNVFAQAPLIEMTDDKDAVDRSKFILIRRPNLVGSYWVVRIKDVQIIGHSRWNPYNRKWTLFNLYDEYRGYLQALIGDDPNEHYIQRTWYDRDNRYIGTFISHLGGRPKSPNLPFGELGGGMDIYRVGNVPLDYATLLYDIDPIKKVAPMGIDISIVPRLPKGR